MPSKDYNYLIDVRDNIHLARKFVRGQTFESFRNDEMIFYAVTRCLEIISEASRRLTNELKLRHPDIPWADIAGAGNIYRHDYEDVQHKLVWGTVQTKLLPLFAAFELEIPGAMNSA
jgi:uncharacterized protein with HEPN domain